MMLPTRRGLRVLNVAAQPILRSIGKVVGGDVLADAIAFFQAFDGMETGFRDRADEVHRAAARRRPPASCWSPRRGSTPSTRPASSPSGWSRRTSTSPPSSSTGRRPTSASRPASGRGAARPTPRCTTTWPSCTRSSVAEHASHRTAARPTPAGRPDMGAAAAGDVHDLDGLDQIRSLLFAGSTRLRQPSR